jgi:drug/metabolite transporter (DMT)-like permease
MLGFNLCLSQIEVGVAYAVWAALGTMVVTSVGIIFFHENCSPVKLFCLALIIAGVVGLNLLESTSTSSKSGKQILFRAEPEGFSMQKLLQSSKVEPTEELPRTIVA